MSLINEALKKAQKQRTGEAPPLASMPSVGGEAPQRIARSGKSSSTNSLLVPVALGATGLVAVLVVGFFLLRGKPAAQTSVETKPIAATPATTPPAPTSTPATTASTPAKTTTPAKADPFVLPVAPPPEPAKTAVVTPKSEPKIEAPKPVAAEPMANTPAKPAEPAAKLEPRAIQYIENLRVTGIRASANDSKVLMNDRVYRIGHIVEHEMGLKLVGITASSLTFEDERGGRYTRNF
jgi:cytoskeletal protein RodZ